MMMNSQPEVVLEEARLAVAPIIVNEIEALECNLHNRIMATAIRIINTW